MMCSGTGRINSFIWEMWIAPITKHDTLGDWPVRSHVLEGYYYFLDLATRFILCLPASSGTTSVRCIWRCISVSDFLCGFFSLDPGTTRLHHLLPCSGTKWAHFTLRWICLLFEILYFQKSKFGRLHQERNLFWLIAPCIIRTTCFFDVDVDHLSFELVKIPLQLFGWFSCWLKTSCLTGRRSSRRRVTL